MRLAETYQREITKELTNGYIDALGDLTEFEVMIGFTAAMRRPSKYMPNPGEIREALALAKEKIPSVPSTHGGCPHCGGSGFKTITHPKAKEDPAWSHYKIAVQCNHEA